MAQGVRLSDEQIEKVAEALAVNPHWRAAANHAGVDEKTLWNYRQRAETYANRNPELPDTNDFDQYAWTAVQTWQAARSSLEMKCAQRLLDAGQKDWKADYTILKALAPQDWSDRVELTGAGGGPVQIEAMKSEALERAEAALRDLDVRALSGEGALPAPSGNDE